MLAGAATNPNGVRLRCSGCRQLHLPVPVTNGSQNGNEYILSGRVDYNLSDKDHLFWRVKMDHGTQPTSVDFINPAFSARELSAVV